MGLQRKSYWAQTLLSYAWLRKFFLNWLIKMCHWLRCTFSNILNQESPGLDVFICCQPPSTFLCLYPPLEPSFIQSWSGIWEWHLQTIEGSDYLWNFSLSHRQFPKWSWKRKRAFENSRAPVLATPCISWSLFLQHKFRWTHHAWLHMKKTSYPPWQLWAYIQDACGMADWCTSLHNHSWPSSSWKASCLPPPKSQATQRAASALCIIHQKTGPLRF